MKRSFPADFLDLLTELNAADAKYLLIGGHAVGIYARPRATKDIDVWVEASTTNAARVLAALRAFGAPLAGFSERDIETVGNGFRMGTPPFRIEILTEISGVSFEEAWNRRLVREVDGVECYLISVDDLIRNKKAAGRPQDLADVDALERAAKRRRER